MFVPGCSLQSGFFVPAKTFFQKYSLIFGSFGLCVVEGLRKGRFYPLSRLRKEVNTLNEPYRTQFEVRCAFNGFCKKVLRCEASNAWRDVRNRQLREISFPTCRRRKKRSFTRQTLIRLMKLINPFLLPERALPQSNLPTHYMRYRKKSAKRYCCTTSLT